MDRGLFSHTAISESNKLPGMILEAFVPPAKTLALSSKLFNLSFEVSVSQLKECRYASEKETSHCWPCFQFLPLTASQLFSSVPYCIFYNLYKMTAFMDSCLWSSSLSGKNHREQGTSLKGRFIRRMTLAQFLVVHQLTFSFSHLPIAILRGQKGD